MFDYEAPIKIIMQEMQAQRENQIYQAIQNIGVDVDKEELLKALSYDRNQYEKGYRAAKDEIVHCKDCKYFLDRQSKNHQGICMCEGKETVYGSEFHPFESDFCNYAERKDEE